MLFMNILCYTTYKDGGIMTDLEYLKKYYKGNMEEALSKLKQGIPVQYIVGEVDFYGNLFEVNDSVLIPRFETEQLIEYTIFYINNLFNKEVNVIDLGTGSGCIAITLKKMMSSTVSAVDISKPALEVAKRNAEKNNADIKFIQGDMLNDNNNKYDVIISNPPYISYDEKIQDVVYNNEPKNALFASNNGLYFYEQILKSCQKNLNDNFLIAFEIGYKQAKMIKDMAYKYLTDIKVDIKKDLNNFDRFVFIYRGNYDKK